MNEGVLNQLLYPRMQLREGKGPLSMDARAAD